MTNEWENHGVGGRQGKLWTKLEIAQTQNIVTGCREEQQGKNTRKMNILEKGGMDGVSWEEKEGYTVRTIKGTNVYEEES